MLLAGELLVLLIWALVITRPYLNLDPRVIPLGREFLSNIQTHHVWTRALECGACAFWNGSVRGGYPALADPQASFLHPLVAAGTLAFGVINGSKISIVGTFVIVGFAQWWLAYVLGTNAAARLWTGALAVVAGHVAGRLELGNFGLPLSTATAALLFPAALLLVSHPSGRNGVIFAAILAAVAVSGQGYVQVGTVFILMTVLILVQWERAKLLSQLRPIIVSLAIAFLFASPFLIPLFQFLPQFGKDENQAMLGLQPLAYVPLNLVIDDYAFFRGGGLAALPYPYHYVNFIGWLPVALAIVGLWAAKDQARRHAVIFLAASALLSFWLAAGAPLPGPSNGPLFQAAPAFRYPSFIAGLAIPPILGLAALGLDRALHALKPVLTANVGARVQVDVRWLLVIRLLATLVQARGFTTVWIGTALQSDGVRDVIRRLQTPTAQWVNTPYGEQSWVEPAISAGLKLGLGTQGWFWKGRQPPDPVIEASRFVEPVREPIEVRDGLYIYEARDREYAYVSHPDGSKSACGARATGGDIDVFCATSRPGVLKVQENNWIGWYAWVDGQPASLQRDNWLAVPLETGSHTIALRYRPWDGIAGVTLFAVGVALAAVVWILDRRRAIGRT